MCVIQAETSGPDAGLVMFEQGKRYDGFVRLYAPRIVAAARNGGLKIDLVFNGKEKIGTKFLKVGKDSGGRDFAIAEISPTETKKAFWFWQMFGLFADSEKYSLAIHTGPTSVIGLDRAGLYPEQDKLRLCGYSLTPPPPPPPPAPADLSAKARPLNYPWINGNDYPYEPRKKNHQGRVGYRLYVNERGWATSCQIVKSSGHSDLDRETCEMAKDRARFVPAKDAQGRPTRSTYTASVDWRLN